MRFTVFFMGAGEWPVRFSDDAGEKGNAEAEFKVGEMYETGFGVEKDMKAAREWINKAAAQA